MFDNNETSGSQSENDEKSSPITILAHETVAEFTSFLDWRSLLHARLACRMFSNVIKQQLPKRAHQFRPRQISFVILPEGNKRVLILHANGQITTYCWALLKDKAIFESKGFKVVDKYSVQRGEFLLLSKIQPLSNIIQVGYNKDFMLALSEGGTVWIQKINSDLVQEEPQHVPDFEGIRQIILRDNDTVLLKNDGTVWLWQHVQYHSSTDLTDSSLDYVTKVADIENVTKVVSSNWAMFFLKQDKTVWQLNSGEQMGTPFEIPGLSEVIDVVTNDESVLFLKEGGTVWSRGEDIPGILAMSKRSPAYRSSDPIAQLPELDNVRQIALGATHCFFVKTDGTVWCNYRFRSTEQGAKVSDSLKKLGRPYPFYKVENIADVEQVITNDRMTCFYLDNGMVWGFGMLAPLTPYVVPHPAPVPFINNWYRVGEFFQEKNPVFFFHDKDSQQATAERMEATRLTEEALKRAEEWETNFRLNNRG